MNKIMLVIVGLLILGAIGYVLATQGNSLRRGATQTAQKTTELLSPVPEAIEEATKEKNVILSELNDSGYDGTAILVEKDGKVVVTINLTGNNAGTNQPAHIHAGDCPGVGAIKYSLSNVVNGKSETTLNVDMATLLDQKPLAINVHESSAKMSNYVACGNL